MSPRAGLFLVMLAAGCAGGDPQPGASAWNGRWVGYFESSVGPLGCPPRGVMDVRVESGRMSGDAQGDAYTIAITGAVGATGEIADGVFRRGGRAAAIMTGTFAAQSAAGRWQGALCEGVWSLRRFF